jgi:hypothetical protein
MEIIDRDSIDWSVEGHSLRDILNFNECVVLDLMREIYQDDSSLCRCDTCIEDVYALTLNALPTRYIQVTSVRTYQESVGFIDKDNVKPKLLEAIDKVKERPNH